jgi:hypothetical protein
MNALNHGLPPGSEPVDPALYCEVVFPHFGDEKFSMPVVIAIKLHRRTPPSHFLSITIEDVASDQIVAIGKDVRFNPHNVPDDSLEWKRTAIDVGANPIHHNSNLPFRRKHPLPRGGVAGWKGFFGRLVDDCFPFSTFLPSEQLSLSAKPIGYVGARDAVLLPFFPVEVRQFCNLFARGPGPSVPV